MPKQRSLTDIRSRPFLNPSHPTVYELRQLDRLGTRKRVWDSARKGTFWREDILRVTPQRNGKDVAPRIRVKPKKPRLPRSLAMRISALG